MKKISVRGGIRCGRHWCFLLFAVCCVFEPLAVFASANEISVHGFSLGQSRETVVKLCRGKNDLIFKKANNQLPRSWPLALTCHIEAMKLYFPEADSWIFLYSRKELERARDAGMESNPYTLGDMSLPASPLAFLGFCDDVMVEMKISPRFIGAANLTNDSLLRQLARATGTCFREVKFSDDRISYKNVADHMLFSGAGSGYFSIHSDRTLIYVGTTYGFGASIDFRRLGSRTNEKINIGVEEEKSLENADKPYLSSEPALALPSDRKTLKVEETSGVDGGNARSSSGTTDKNKKGKCKLCKGSGLSPFKSVLAVPNFDGKKKIEWCNVCKSNSEVHSHNICPVCLGEND